MRKQHEKHGMSYTPAYASWTCMMNRCNNHKNTAYKYYGGKGIKVCKKWMLFKGFYADMGDRPKGLTLERKDNEKGYNKRNCKWATMAEQSMNKINSVFLDYLGEQLTINQLSEKVNISRNTIEGRRLKGWKIEDIIAKPVCKSISFNGVVKSMAQWSRDIGGGRELVRRRLKNGWPINKAVTTKVKKYNYKLKG